MRQAGSGCRHGRRGTAVLRDLAWVTCPSEPFSPSCHRCKRMANRNEAKMVPQALGYVGVRAKDMGDRKQRIIIDADGGEGIGFFGWEVADAAALEAIAANLENNEIKVARGA